ncbi:plasmid replication initiator protein [Deinococcus cavernae]|uniref:Plasmid replication initiator protein n=2 Tax=Deinococcus cavernae TaxID=2320857 RepID=A0A418VGF0_9DEIO|nr:plasmid replication initiator protein [Deinococcus cavernae]
MLGIGGVMPRKPAKTLVAPKPYTELIRLDEANVGRLGLISIQERIPDDYTSGRWIFWLRVAPARLTCESVPRYGGVPHGLEGDIASAIILMFHEQDCPPDGVIRTTAYQLLKLAGLDASGRYYKALKLSLFRLRTATYFASEAWREHPKGNWTTVTFNYLDGLEFTSQREEQELSGASAILIRLAQPIVRSIRAEYVKPLDVEFLTSLNRPLTRALYRLLDARRYDPLQPQLPHSAYTVNVNEWGEACKIVDPRTNKIRATLQGAHEELIERGYLRNVDYVGRGKKQVMTYLFADHHSAFKRPPTPLVQQLLDLKVSLAGAWKLVDEFGEERVGQRIARYKHLVERGYQAKNKSGLLVDIIQDNGGKYGDDAEDPTEVKGFL